MKFVQIINRAVTLNVTADGALEIADQEVEPGYVLRLRNMSLTGTNHGAGEYLYVGWRDVQSRHYLTYAVNTGATAVVTDWKGEVWLGEGQKPMAYLLAANSGEIVEFTVSGLLYTLKGG